MKTIARIGIDLAKNVFQVHGVDCHEKVALQKRLVRDKVLEFFANLNRDEHCVVGMESCCGSDYWARELIKMGYDVKIMNPRFVKPYVKSNKNDKRDAEAICEAVGRPTMRFIPVKTLAQQDMILLHRQREQLIRRRTAQSNQLRGLLLNYGVIIAQGYSALSKQLPVVLANDKKMLTVKALEVVRLMYDEIMELTDKVAKVSIQLQEMAKNCPKCQKLITIPGIGYLNASAIVAWLGDGSQFKCARDAAAYIGLVPTQHSSGNTERLGRISKRGNRYLRTLLILGAHADLRMAEHRLKSGLTTARDEWSVGLKDRRHTCVAAVALAAKNIRIAWALLRDDVVYAPNKMAA